jgi:hypothetical protein
MHANRGLGIRHVGRNPLIAPLRFNRRNQAIALASGGQERGMIVNTS